MKTSPDSSMESSFARTNELGQIGNVRLVRHFRLEAFESLLRIELGTDQDPVGPVESRYALFGKAVALEPDLVEAVRLRHVAVCLAEGQDILADRRERSDESVGADSRELMAANECRQDDAVADLDMPSQRGVVGEDTARS